MVPSLFFILSLATAGGDLTFNGVGIVSNATGRLMAASNTPQGSSVAAFSTHGSLAVAHAVSSSQWVVEDVAAAEFPPGALSVASLPDSRIAVAWQAVHTWDLMYSVASPDGWTTVTVDTTGFVGEFASLAVLDASVGGRPAIAYFDRNGDSLKYALSITAAGHSSLDWVALEVSRGGQWASLATVNGAPAVAHADPSRQELLFIASSSPDGLVPSSWPTGSQAIVSGTFGRSLSLVSVANGPGLAYATDDGVWWVAAMGGHWGTPVLVNGGTSVPLDGVTAAVVPLGLAVAYANDGVWVSTSPDGNAWVASSAGPGTAGVVLPSLTVIVHDNTTLRAQLAVASPSPSPSYCPALFVPVAQHDLLLNDADGSTALVISGLPTSTAVARVELLLRPAAGAPGAVWATVRGGGVVARITFPENAASASQLGDVGVSGSTVAVDVHWLLQPHNESVVVSVAVSAHVEGCAPLPSTSPSPTVTPTPSTTPSVTPTPTPSLSPPAQPPGPSRQRVFNASELGVALSGAASVAALNASSHIGVALHGLDPANISVLAFAVVDAATADGWVEVIAEGGSLPQLCTVQGLPTVAHFAGGSLAVLQADRRTGLNATWHRLPWSLPAAEDCVAIADVAGTAAIAFSTPNGSLGYAVGLQPPVVVSATGAQPSLAVIGGHPTIAYVQDNTIRLAWAHGNGSTASQWGSAAVIDRVWGGAAYCQLYEVDPAARSAAVAFVDTSRRRLVVAVGVVGGPPWVAVVLEDTVVSRPAFVGRPSGLPLAVFSGTPAGAVGTSLFDDVSWPGPHSAADWFTAGVEACDCVGTAAASSQGVLSVALVATHQVTVRVGVSLAPGSAPRRRRPTYVWVVGGVASSFVLAAMVLGMVSWWRHRRPPPDEFKEWREGRLRRMKARQTAGNRVAPTRFFNPLAEPSPHEEPPPSGMRWSTPTARHLEALQRP